MANEVTWSEATWKEINDAVLMEVGKVRTAQKVFPTARLDNSPTQVPDELINFQNLSIQEGATKPFVEAFATLTLTSTQVNQEADQKTCRTLARMAAKALALAEDTYFFQTSADGPRGPGNPQLPANTKIDNWRLALDLGLLREANPPPDNNNGDPATRVTQPLDVNRAPQNPNNAQWGNNTFSRVAEAITLLVGKAQAAPYALFLPTEAYADTFIPPSPDSLVTTADRIKPLVEGGFYTSPVLPRYEGLLVALAGDPVNLFVGREVVTEFVVREGNNFVFRVVERIQYVVRDPRALVLFRFIAPPQNAAAPQNAAPRNDE
jgi:uncharacterized linocin/CFP29 family protein